MNSTDTSEGSSPVTSPVVSVVMAAYNGAALIGDTIASVLAQTFADFELVVVDDCSTDDTLAVVRAIADPRLVVVAAEVNGGPVAARNRAFSAARGRYIVGLDQDDLCHPDRFARQVAYLDSHPDTVLVASAADFLEGGAIRPPRAPFATSPALIDWRMHFGNPLVWSSVMFRAEAARRLEVFERSERLYAEDYDLYHRLTAFGALARIDEPLLTYRIHAGGASNRYTTRMIESAAAVLEDLYGASFGTHVADLPRAEAARLVMRHFGGGLAVPDAVTLERVNRAVDTIHRHILATRQPDAGDLALIEGEYARLWWQMADASVRSGAISLGHATRRCPKGLIPRHPSPRRALSSVLIGRVRSLAPRRNARRAR